MAEIFTSENIIALLALTSMEIVLGIDNIVFIAIITGKLPEEQQASGRRIGLGLALGVRLLLLLTLSWILGLTEPLFHLASLGLGEGWLSEHEHVNVVSWRDLIMLGGGLFLIGKATFEVHERLEPHEEKEKQVASVSFGSVLLQIAVLDIVFSLDSVITAVGMAREIWVMVVAVIVAVGVMLIFAERVSAFVARHPTVKMLALSFLLLIGVMLVAEGVGTEIPKGYIYFAMAFALGVEVLNLRAKAVRRASEYAAHPAPAPDEAR